jgi:hypothetical protein
MGGASSSNVLGHPAALFGAAVLHVIVVVKQGSWRFLFGYVELLPREMPPPPHDGSIAGPHLRRSGFRVYADHVPVTVERGLLWYEDAREGRIVRPGQDGSVPLVDDVTAVTCDPHGWDQEPPWPAFISAASASALPFLCRWHSTPRTHHLLASSRELPFQPDELAELDEFFEREAGFRRSEFPQLFGSAHLVVPNPYFRALHELLDDDFGPRNESISVHVDVRNGVSLPPMSINIVDHRPVGIGRSVDVSLTSTPTKVPMGIALRRTSATIRLTGDGSVLEVREPAPFMREFHMTMDITSSKRTVNVTDSTGAVVETYEVSVGQPHVSRTGNRPPSAAADALEVMLNEIEVRASAKELDQQWFADNAVAARDFVRTLICRAREQVLMADPYLSGLEVQRFALATTVAHVSVRMLTTRDGFSSGGLPPAALAKNLARWQGEESTLGKL